ncbi:hypothetical protein SAMCFNEI73_pC0064 (plasmid) [Sinorhizobium americanum]|uniref:Uncharacterized protein n=1 Tax=Sinorhizobium americanum TaxID=194963 RepID=A0A1L3LUN5_9HYPH|nr:hypothetical protein SAMCCGM7_pC0065 [Sinorhizobium americanum CCGM7]APG93788.1 hypothetical protein SAMCFNEI73_pC0064 [Sinorhizobium americanum]
MKCCAHKTIEVENPHTVISHGLSQKRCTSIRGLELWQTP